MEYSELLNLPSPIFKAIAKSPTVFLKQQIKHKRSLESKFKKMEQSFTQGKKIRNEDLI